MDKDQLIQSIHSERRQFERYLFYFEKDPAGGFRASNKLKFSLEELNQPGVIGVWSIKDLLVNLAAWERKLLSWIDKSESPISDELEALQNPDSPQNKQIYQAHLDDSPEQILAEFHSSYADTLDQIHHLTEGDLLKPRIYKQTEIPVSDLIETLTEMRYRWAKSAIRQWRKKHQQTQKSKESLLTEIQQEHQRLVTLIEGIAPQKLIEPGVCGEWSIKDILAHLTAWEQLFLGWYRTGLCGETPQIPAPGITWKQLGKLNRMIYEAHRFQELVEIKNEFEKSYQTILQEITEMSEETISTPGYFSWTSGYNLQGYIRANTVSHYRWAKNQIRGWLKNN